MGFLSRFFGASKKESSIPFSSGFLGGFGGILSQSNRTRPSDYYKSWVFSCTRAIAEKFSTIELLLFEVNPQTGEKVLRNDADPMRLLLRPNPIMTKETLFTRVQSHKELFGNEYWFISRLTNGVPVGIIPLRPENTNPIASTSSFVKGYRTVVDGTSYDIPVEDIVHFKNFSPMSDLVGMSTLGAAQDAAETDVYAREYNKEFFNNGAVPGAVITVKGDLDPEAKKRLKQTFDQKYSGQSKRYKTFVATGGLDIKEFSVNQRDMEFMEQRKFSRDEILAIFGIPKPIIGILEDVNRASAEAALFIFALLNIEPKMRSFVDTLNAFYLPLFKGHENYVFEFRTPVPKDKAMKIQEYKDGIAGGWLTQNEVRSMEGLPPLKDGDMVYLPLSLQPVSSPVEQKKEVNIVITKDTAAKSIISSLKKVLSEGVVQKCDTDDGCDPQVKLMDEKLEKMGEAKAKNERTRLAKEEAVYSREAMKMFERQKRTATKNLVTALKSASVKAEDGVADLLDEKEEVKKTIAIFTPLMLATIKVEGDAAFDFLGLDEELALGAISSRKFVKKHVTKMAKTVTEDTLNKLRKEVAKGLDNDEDLDSLVKRVQNSVAFDKARAEKIARTETFRMRTQGEMEAWKKSGVVEAKIWYTALDERVDPNCAAMHGEEISLSKTYFSLGDQLSNGQTVNYEPIVGPPLHPQCRCTLLPVVKSKSFNGGTKDLSVDEKLELYKSINDERRRAKEEA